MWRPSPLMRARRLEQALGTPAKIYYKYEGVSPAGSHKPNTAVPQAWYNKEAGIKRLSTETGAGQWGSSLAFAGALFGIDVTVFQVRVSYDQKPYRRASWKPTGRAALPRRRTRPSPAARSSPRSEQPGLARHRHLRGGRGGRQGPGGEILARLGVNHVLLHQTVNGQEAIQQFEMAGDDPDVIIGCTGGGLDFAGLAFPFLGLQLRGGRKRRFVAVEPAACPSLTRGKYAYDFGDTAHLTPWSRCTRSARPSSRRVPCGRPALSRHGADGVAHPRTRLDRGARLSSEDLLRCRRAIRARRGPGSAPEATHAVRCAIDEALRCKQEGKTETILFNMSGHGHFDMAAYIAYYEGKLVDQDYDERELAMALAGLPSVAA